MFPEKYFLISDYQSVKLLGVDGLFTNYRVDVNSLPEGFYKYSLRDVEDDFLSSVKRSVLFNHMGDFICKKELDLKGQDELDLCGDYDFTGEDIDLNEFFGVDIKAKIASELDDFCFEFDSYEYQDTLCGSTREDIVGSIRDGLNDKEYVSDMIKYFQNLLKNNAEEHFLSSKDEQTVHSFLSVLTDINTHNRDSLDNIVEYAAGIKDMKAQGEQGKEPEIQ